MKLLRKILLATDLTEASEDTVRYAIGVAKGFNSTLTLLHVSPGSLKKEGNSAFSEEDARQRLEELHECILQEGVAAEQPMLKYGEIADQIIATSSQTKANLIMIGTGQGFRDKSGKLGSNIIKLMRKSTLPVWVKKSGGALEIQNILCPVDFSAESKRALDNAIVLSRSFGAKLVIFSVFELYDKNYPRFSTKQGGMNNLIGREHERRLNAFLCHFNFAGVDFENQVQPGSPAKEILKAIRSNQTDLLIMGTSARSALHRMLIGSVTETVTREMPCSFATLKAENILTPELDISRSIEEHYADGMRFMRDGRFKEAISEFMIGLQINDNHVPSLLGLAEVNQKMGNMESSASYKNMAVEIMNREENSAGNETKQSIGVS